MLAVEGVTKVFAGGTKALDGVSLDVDEGEMVAVLGPSGGGKSTLFQCIIRLAEPTAGRISVGGVDILALRGRQLAKMRRRIGMVFQQYNLAQRLSALDNVLAGRIAEAPLWRVLSRTFTSGDRELAMSCLDRVGMADYAHQRAGSLSGGQQQRVAIARALCQQPRLLIADEPVSSLDPESANQVMEVLSTINERDGITVLCSLHQVHLAQSYAPRIVGLNNGKITADNIVNYTAKEIRRVDIVAGVSYGDDLDKVKKTLADILAKDERVLRDPAPTIGVLELADSSVNFVVRPWVKTADYWDVYFATQESIKKRFDAEGITIPFPQQDVHLHKTD